MTAPRARGGGFNDADLRYLRRALVALKDAQQASDQAAAWSSDPGVRAVARRARTMQAVDISNMASMLEAWGRDNDGPEHPEVREPTIPTVFAAGDLSALARLELDRRLVENLINHAEAAITSSRTEMIEGLEPSIRRMAEDAIRGNSRDLSALRPVTSTRPRSGAPVTRGTCVKHRA